MTETPVRPFVKTSQSCQVVVPTLAENRVCGVEDEEMELEGEQRDGEGEIPQLEWQQREEEEKIVTGEKPDRLSRDDGAREVKKLVDPLKPTQKEVDEHNLFHTPYRNWCPICVKAKGKSLDHQRKVETNPSGYSEYSFDYGFPGDEFGFKLTVLGRKERRTGMRFATAVPTKGASGKFSSDKVLQFMEELGDKASKVMVKTDQEPSIKYLVNDIIEGRPSGQTVPEMSPVKSSGSNGMVERCIQDLEGQLRAVLLAFESRLGKEVDAKEPIVTFMPEYTAYVLNRRDVGLDGKTAYERNTCKKATFSDWSSERSYSTR